MRGKNNVCNCYHLLHPDLDARWRSIDGDCQWHERSDDNLARFTICVVLLAKLADNLADLLDIGTPVDDVHALPEGRLSDSCIFCVVELFDLDNPIRGLCITHRQDKVEFVGALRTFLLVHLTGISFPCLSNTRSFLLEASGFVSESSYPCRAGLCGMASLLVDSWGGSTKIIYVTLEDHEIPKDFSTPDVLVYFLFLSSSSLVDSSMKRSMIL
jgi:hypothetical protein